MNEDLTPPPDYSQVQKSVEAARKLQPGEPPPPWGNRYIVNAAGIFAGGWDADDGFWLFSRDGWSRTDVIERTTRLELFGHEETLARFDKDKLHFTPFDGKSISTFGVKAGNGVLTRDYWSLDIIYPWWPLFIVTLQNFRTRTWNGDIENRSAIQLLELSPADWVRCGFSPSGKHFAILGEAGTEIFSRDDL